MYICIDMDLGVDIAVEAEEELDAARVPPAHRQMQRRYPLQRPRVLYSITFYMIISDAYWNSIIF